MAEAVLGFFWQEHLGQEILWSAQHGIALCLSALLGALISRLESLGKIVGGGTGESDKVILRKNLPCVNALVVGMGRRGRMEEKN